MGYRILLYYFYTEIDDPEGYRDWQRELCERLGLKGRILVAREGINGTVSGTEEATEEYRQVMDADQRTAGMEWKVDEAEGHAFPRLSVKARTEVVTLGLGEEDFSPREVTGEYLNPVEWREAMKEEDVVMIDARNDYEWEMGHFEGAVLPDVPSFRELPEWVEKNRELLEGKKILTYCTGGIRCEKFSGFLVREGFESVYQLHGGIVTYGKDEEARGEGFAGKCYVFDERIGVEVNRTEGARVVARCQYCDKPCDRQVNCAWTRCNERFFCCERCEAEQEGFCCGVCREAVMMREVAVLGE
ncbi:MAG: rhodanese-related sulfurtransferase [Verrucomicrobiota bacterium]